MNIGWATLAIIASILVTGIILCTVILLVILLSGRRKRVLDRRADSPPSQPRPSSHAVSSDAEPHGMPRESPPPVSVSHPPGPALIGLSGPLAQEAFPIHRAPRGLTIGRNPNNDVVISDMLAISRYHAQIIPEGSDFVLYDRDSANGTVVNNQRIWSHKLQDGDQIQICGARFVFSQSGRMPGRVATPPESAPPSESLIFSPNTWFEGYWIEEGLGHGGMSVVYKARDREGNIVAIKILNVTDEYVVRKFIQEQQIGAILRGHPYIRTVYHLGRSQQRNLYLVMEYVDGYSLRRLIGTLSDEEIVRIMGQTCMALACAHEQRIVHRDIKPENILIAHDGNVKVTDFGIAKLTSSVTVTSDRVVGTPEYLSPEQARGEQSIKPSTDIYSLGIVLYELLTGRVPFPLPRDSDPYRAAVTVLSHHVNTPPPLPRRQNPKVTPRLEKVALRAIEKDPRKRYPTALAMSGALGYQAEAMPEAAKPEPLGGFSLVVTQGAQVNHRILVEADSVTIGRADLDPEDVLVSRRHAVISPRGNQIWLEDTSLNGTFVNSERVFGEVLLHAGDEIRIGESVLSVTAM